MKANPINDTSSGKLYETQAFPKNRVNMTLEFGLAFNIALRCWKSLFDRKPVDPTDGVFRLVVTNEKEDKTVLIFSSSLDITAEENNILRIKKPADEMVIDPGLYTYEFTQTTPSADTKLMQGDFIVKPPIAVATPKLQVLKIDGQYITVDNQIILI